MKEYRVTLLKILIHLIGVIIVFLIGIYGFYSLFIQDTIPKTEQGKFLFMIISYLLFFSFLLGYPLFIIFNHYIFDHYTVLTINYKHKNIIYKTQNKTKEFLISDISNIVRTDSSFRGCICHYYEIFLKDDTLIRITSLVIPILDKEFRKINQSCESEFDIRLYRK